MKKAVFDVFYRFSDINISVFQHKYFSISVQYLEVLGV